MTGERPGVAWERTVSHTVEPGEMVEFGYSVTASEHGHRLGGVLVPREDVLILDVRQGINTIFHFREGWYPAGVLVEGQVLSVVVRNEGKHKKDVMVRFVVQPLVPLLTQPSPPNEVDKLRVRVRDLEMTIELARRALADRGAP